MSTEVHGSETKGILGRLTVVLRLEGKGVVAQGLAGHMESDGKTSQRTDAEMRSRMQQRREMNLGCGGYCRRGTGLCFLLEP